MTKLAIVTGASSGIGRATAMRLAADGFHVLAVGRDERAVGEVMDAIADAGGVTSGLVADVTAADAPARIVDRAISVADGIDALVNAAGIIASGSAIETTDDGWDTMLDVNVRAPFRLLRQAAP